MPFLVDLQREALALEPDDDFGWEHLLSRVDEHPINPQVEVRNHEVAYWFGLLDHKKEGILYERWREPAQRVPRA